MGLSELDCNVSGEKKERKKNTERKRERGIGFAVREKNKSTNKLCHQISLFILVFSDAHSRTYFHWLLCDTSIQSGTFFFPFWCSVCAAVISHHPISSEKTPPPPCTHDQPFRFSGTSPMRTHVLCSMSKDLA